MLCAPPSPAPNHNLPSDRSLTPPLKSQHCVNGTSPPPYFKDAEYTVTHRPSSVNALYRIQQETETATRVYYVTIDKFTRQQWALHRRRPPYSFSEMWCLHSMYAKSQQTLLGIMDPQPAVYLAGEDSLFTQPIETMTHDWEDYMDSGGGTGDCTDSDISSSSGNSRINSVESLTASEYGPPFEQALLDPEYEHGHQAYNTASLADTINQNELTWYPVRAAYFHDYGPEHYQIVRPLYEEESLLQHQIIDEVESQEISDDDYDWCPCDHGTTENVVAPVYHRPYHHHHLHHDHQQPQQQPTEPSPYYHEPHELQYHQSSIAYGNSLPLDHYKFTHSFESTYPPQEHSISEDDDWQPHCGYGTNMNQDYNAHHQDISPVSWLRVWRVGQVVVDVLYQALARAELYEKEMDDLEAAHQTAPITVSRVDIFSHKILCVVRLWHFLFQCVETILIDAKE